MNEWKVLAAVALLAVPLAGCMEALDESRTTGDDDANERRIAVDVPDGASEIVVDVTARQESGEADVTILVEDASGANLAEDTFSVRGDATRQVRVDASGHDRLTVIVRVLDGDASLDVRVTAVVPGQPAVVVVREQVVIRVERVEATPTPTTTATPTGATPTPTATTTPTNATNGTNASG